MRETNLTFRRESLEALEENQIFQRTYNSLAGERYIYAAYIIELVPFLLLLLVRMFSRFIDARAIKGDTLCRGTHRAKEKEKKDKVEGTEKETRYRGGFSSFQKNGRES